MGNVTLPGIGPVDQKYVYAGGALVVGIIGYAYWRRSQEMDVPQWSDVDPSEMVPDAEYDNPGGGSNIPPQDLTDGAIRTNAEWAQAATERLSIINYEPRFVADAIGQFLARNELTALQAAAILTAKGQLGEPPQGGPWPVRIKGPTSPPPDDRPPRRPTPGPARAVYL